MPRSQKPLGAGRRKPDLSGGRLLSEPGASGGFGGPGLLSGGPSAAGLSFPSPFYSLAMLYDSASSEPHKSSPRKEAAAAAVEEE